jgi:hypothetical protein
MNLTHIQWIFNFTPLAMQDTSVYIEKIEKKNLFATYNANSEGAKAGKKTYRYLECKLNSYSRM